MKSANKALALKAVKDRVKVLSGKYSSIFTIKAKILEDALKEYNWDVELNEDYDIIRISFSGDKLSDEVMIFAELAPFVESGSYIECRGDDGEMWRWIFQDGKLEEKKAKIVWE